METLNRIVVAGGGIGGLAAALSLAATGRRVTVLERRTSFSEAGAGIQIGPNGVHALRQLGAADYLTAHVGIPQNIVVRDGATGRVLQRLPLGAWIEERHGAPYWVAHRRDLQAALLAACRDNDRIQVIKGIDVRALEEAPDKVTAIDSLGMRHEGRLLIGADGVYSRLRDYVAPGFSARFSGRTAARTVIASTDAPPAIDPQSTGVWIAPGAHVVHYPVRQGRDIAVVVIRQEAWTGNDAVTRPKDDVSWAGPGWSEPIDAAVLTGSLQGFSSVLQNFLLRGGDWRRWALFEAPALPRWSVGRVVLLGDAAHPILPFLAQGGCLALEDALSLAGAISRHGETGAALTHYAAGRRPRALKIASASRRNGRIFHLSGLAARARDLVLRSLPGERVMAKYDWVYAWRAPD